MSPKKRFIGWILLVICILLSLSLVRAWRRFLDRRSIISDAYERLEDAKRINEKLTRELAKTQTQEFIEKQAREKLNLAREGEVVVILPPITPMITPTPTPEDSRTNWEKWVRVFL